MSRKNRITLAVAMAVVLAVVLTLGLFFLFRLADRQFSASAEILSAQIADLIQRNETERTELQDSLKEEYISRARALAYLLEKDSDIEADYDQLCEVAELMNIDEVNVFDRDGLIAFSTVPDYVGFSIYSGGQIAFFEPMMEDRSLALCQDLTPNTKDGKLIMYAAVWRADGDSLVQIGIMPDQLLSALEKNDISRLLDHMPVDAASYFIYDAAQDQIAAATDRELIGLSDRQIAFHLRNASGEVEHVAIGGEKYIYTTSVCGDYIIGVSEPESRAYRDAVTDSFVLSVFMAFSVLGLFLTIVIMSNRDREKEQVYVNGLRDAADQLSSYKRAILSDALISLEVNLSRDELYYGVWKDDGGNEVPLKEIIGLEMPCSYDQYITVWNQRFVKRDVGSAFSGNTDREHLIREFQAGRAEVTFDYEAKTISGRSTWLRRSICMTQNQAGDVIAYTSVKDVSALVAQDKRDEAFVRALATEYESIAVVQVTEDKSYDRVVVHSRVSDNFAALIDEETLQETSFLRKLTLLRKFIHPEDRERFASDIRRENVLASFAENQAHKADFRLMKPDGSHLYYQLRFVPLRDDEGAVTGMIACMRNIDDEIRREFGIRQELEDAMVAAEAANRAKFTFLFNMSHDIRTPMNAIIGFTDIAEKHIDDRARVLEALGKVKMSGEHLLSLINDVLDMSRVESGQVTIEEEPMMIDTAKDNLYSILAGSAAEKNILLSSVLDPSLTHHWIYADRLRMMRVLTNIVSNSVKYTNPGGRIDLAAAELPCEKEGFARFRYTVADTGIGMSQEYLAHIFEPFTRAESATKSGVVGTGLGMAITKSLVELMGGTIAIESEPGKGTTVTLEFENRIAEPVDPVQEAAAVEFDGLAGKKILLVEDNELNREIAAEILEEEGILLDVAEDGDIAVEKVRTAEAGQYDLILMDIQMPRMNGYEASKAIRSLPDPALASIPIVAMTANAFDEDRKNAAAAGMNGHIAKPIDVPKLFSTLAEILKE